MCITLPALWHLIPCLGGLLPKLLYTRFHVLLNTKFSFYISGWTPPLLQDSLCRQLFLKVWSCQAPCILFASGLISFCPLSASFVSPGIYFGMCRSYLKIHRHLSLAFKDCLAHMSCFPVLHKITRSLMAIFVQEY